MEVHVEIAAETLFKLGPLEVTNSMLTMFLVMGFILLVGRIIASKAQTVPGRAQGMVEMIVEFLMSLVEGTAGRTLGRRIFPMIASIFIFVILANYSGLLPGVGTIGTYHTVDHGTSTEEDHGGGTLEGDGSGTVEEHQTGTGDEGAPASEEEHQTGTGGAETPATDEDHQGSTGAPYEVAAAGSAVSATAAKPAEAGEKVLVPFFRAPNADLNMTLALALVTFVSVQVLGIRAHGVGGRLKHMADPPFLFPIELISEFSRIISLSARLFGNVFAGEVLLAVMYAMAASIKIAVVPFLFPVVFLGLELLFGAIQALVFALLTVIYITLAAAHHGHDEDHAHANQPAGAPHPVAAGTGD